MRREDGVALPLAVLVIVILEGLALIVTLAIVNSAQSQRRDVGTFKAHAAGEGGLWSFLAASGEAGFVLERLLDTLPGGVAFRVDPVRLGPRTHLLGAVGRDATSQAEQALGLLVREEVPAFELTAALSHQGSLSKPDEVEFGDPAAVGGLSLVCGLGTRPELRAVVSATVPSLAFDAMASRGLVIPSPALIPSPTLDSGGACIISSPLNWGDPTDPARPCGSHLPVMVRRGDLVLAGGVGQGVLLVDGDLTLDGGFTYQGLIVVRGRLTVGIGGATVTGAMVVEGRKEHQIRGRLRIAPSRCLAELGLPGTGEPSPIPPFSWIEVM